MINLSSFIRLHAQRTPERTAPIYDGVHLSYAEFHQRILAAAGFLAERGIGSGDVVALLIRDDESRALPAGSPGEICARGPKATPGYWKDPVKTAQALADGWLRIGDVRYLDADGFLYLTDRKKDMIIPGDENIASSEAERAVYELPSAHDAVIGVPDPMWGERPVAVVVLKPGHTLGLATLSAHCRARLATFKVPKELILMDTFPLTASGKVLKRELRRELAVRAHAAARAP